MEEYFTVTQDSAGTVEAKRSKFIAALHHVESEAEALDFINREKSSNFSHKI